MKYSFTMESDNFEADVAAIVEVALTAFERYSKIDKESNNLKNEIAVSEVKADVKGLDNRIDDLESNLDFFKEVLTDSFKKEKKDK